jgi:hypothetical protein
MSGNNDAGGTGDAEFDAFTSTGGVEGTFDGAAGAEAKADEKADDKPEPKRRGPPREAPKQDTAKAPAGDDDAGEGEGEGEGDGEGDEDEDEKPQKTARDHQIERLKREKSDLNKRLRAFEGGAGTAALQAQITALESRLTGGKSGDSKSAGKAAPDPTDATKYPLGHLDDRYIEDKLEWLAEQKASKQADTALQRQQELERNEAASRQQQDILGKVDDLSAKGEALYPDFQEEVVETGMRGDWDLQQPTFEACHEAENGAQILYELSQDAKEAKRVARLSPYQQMKFVQERDAEIGSGGKPNKIPKAGAPPKNTARGANSKTQINPATDDLGDFEKQWERDAKGQK